MKAYSILLMNMGFICRFADK